MSMAGVVSLLDDERSDHVEHLWGELEHEFGIRGVFVTPYPHFSYHVAESYDTELLEPILSSFCRANNPFRVQTTGLGVFTGERPVLYVPIVRDPALVRLHVDLWAAIRGTSTSPQAYYAPRRWMPHITIAFGDLDAHHLGSIITYLSSREFSWECPIDNVTLIDSPQDEQTIHWRFELGNGDRTSA